MNESQRIAMGSRLIRRLVVAFASASLLNSCTGGDGGTTTPSATIGVAASSIVQSAARGATASYVLTVSRSNFAGTVALAADALPAGFTTTFTPASLSGSATSTVLTVAVGSAVAPGTYTIPVHVSGDGVETRTITLSLTVSGPAVSLALGLSNTSVTRGNIVTVPIAIGRSNGAAGDVSLSVSGLPSGTTAALAPAVLASNVTSSVLTVNVGATTTPGVYELAIIASGADGATGTATFALTVTAVSNSLTQLGVGPVAERYTAEVWVRGTTGYTTTWGTRNASGNAVKIWDVSGNTPTLVDSVIVANAGTLGDVQVSDDGSLLVVAIEPRPNGGLALYSLVDPRKPQLVSRYTTANLQLGVHTAEVARVAGKLYAFCAIDPGNGVLSKLVIVDISNPASPVEVSVMTIGNPFIHDVFVKNGWLLAAEWNNGLAIYDIGAVSGSPASPRFVSRVATVNGQVHNVWWYTDPSNSARSYAFVGEEGPGAIGSSSQGDIHVVDMSNLNTPREIAFYHVNGAGTHNFTMDEQLGILYAAYYNGGVRALDVSGDLSACDASQKSADGRCQLHLIPGRERAVQQHTIPVYVWGVQLTGGALYASDMLNGLFKFTPLN